MSGVLRLAGLQVRSLVRSPLAMVAMVGIVPLYWLQQYTGVTTPIVLIAYYATGSIARGDTAGGMARFGVDALPALPLSLRARAGAALLTALTFLFAAYGATLAIDLLRPGGPTLPEALPIAGAQILAIFPLIATGAAFGTGRPDWYQVGLVVPAFLAAGYLGVPERLPATLAWGIGGTALLFAVLPRAARGAPIGGGGEGAPAVVTTTPAASPTRAFWSLVGRQRVLIALVLAASALATAATAGMHAMLCMIAAASVTVASMFVPIGPSVTFTAASGALARLPIAPRTVWRHGLATALFWFALSVTLPSIAFVTRLHWTPEGRVDDLVGSAGYAAVLWFLLLAALLVRAGSHLRPLLRHAAPANVALLLGLVLLGMAIRGPLGPQFAAHWGEPDFHPWRVVLVAGVLTAAVLAWADRSVGVRPA